jgi:prepilin-type N-terminal cleavage/methylation domain-containing protein
VLLLPHRPFISLMIYILSESKTTAGFTLLEVLVSIALTATFVSLALQGMSVAAVLQARAIQSAEAANWIQADLETLRLLKAPHHTVFDPTLCQATQADRGFAQALHDRITSKTATTLRHSRTGQKFTLDRTFSIEPLQPYNILGIRYAVKPESNSKSILNFYTEVIPDAAFTCE